MSYKYERAVYRDQDDRLHTIDRKDLLNPLTMGHARSVRLYDETEEYRLFPRDRAGAAHFFCRSPHQRRLVSSQETDPRHDDRRDELFQQLTTITRLKIGYREYFGPGDFEFVEIAEINDYHWGTEVVRITPHGLRVRHDVFGATRQLAMSERRPWIAIEVIATHYPDEDTFRSFIDLSAELPLIVAFDLVDVPNYFLKLDEQELALRVIYYIYDGSVWRSHKRTDILTAGALKAVMEHDARGRKGMPFLRGHDCRACCPNSVD